MRVFCLYIQHFAAAVETKANPELGGKPFVVGGSPHERKPVFDCSPEAAAFGIRPGLSLRQAHHLCPEAAFLPLDESRYVGAFEEVLAVLDRFSPAVEPDSPGRAFLDATGLGKRFGSEETLAGQVLSEVFSQTGFPARVGVGNGKFVAEVAAGLCSERGFIVVAEAEEKGFLATATIDLLPVGEETKRRLNLLGLRTLGQLSSLPPEALASQFGQEGLLAHRLASGIDGCPVVPRPRPAILEDEVHFESPLESVEGLVAAVSTLLDRLLPPLLARGQVCGKLRLRCDLDGHGARQEWLSLKAPTSSKQEMLRRIRHRLQRLRFPAGISGVGLALAELGSERASQAPLPAGTRGRPESELARVARDLTSRLGKPSLKKVVVLDLSSRIPERRAALVDLPETDD